MKLCRFTDKGRDRFIAFLDAARDGASRVVDEELLFDPVFAERFGDVDTPEGGFVSKLEFAQAAHAAFSGAGIEEALRTDRLIWMWLTARYFGDLCKDAKGNPRKLLEKNRYITAGPDRTYALEKNLLYFPWKMVLLYGEGAHWMLGGAIGADTKVSREIANKQRNQMCRGFVEAARRLYYDESRKVIRKGATNANAVGGLRELERTVSLLDMTYDIFGVDAAQLAAMLPGNRFGRWMKRSMLANG
jgi:hypothetical protein